MINISTHPVWDKVNKFKKPLHLLRINLARKYAKLFPRDKFIGVTGSVGKTSTIIASEAILTKKYNVLTSKLNLDPIFNIPITLLKITPKTQKVILEFGIEYPGEMEFYLSLVKPNTAIITKISYQHSEFLGDLNNIAKQKGLLVEQLPSDGRAILNYDDPLVRNLAKKTYAKVYFFGTGKKNCFIYADNIKVQNNQLIFNLNYNKQAVSIKTKFIGKHQVYPLLAASTLGVLENISLENIKNALESLKPAAHRLQVISGIHNCIILDDTYNGSPTSVEQALETLNNIKSKRKILVLGEMRELGSLSETLHKQIAIKILENNIDSILLGKGDTKYIYQELLSSGFKKERMEYDLQNQEIISKLVSILRKGDVVLVKGARAVKLEEVVENIKI